MQNHMGNHESEMGTVTSVAVGIVLVGYPQVVTY